MTSSTKKRLAAVFFGLALLAALLVPAELFARWKRPAQAGPADFVYDVDYFHLQIHDDFFRLEKKFGVIPYRYRTQRDRAGLQYFSLWKHSGTVRVFIVGGSVAMGFNDHVHSRLGEFLERALPGRKFEIVGCGMGGYDSYRDGLVEQEVLRHSPDLIVLLSGNNEYSSAVRINPFLFRLNRVLRRSRLYQEIQDARQAAAPEAPWPLEDRLRNLKNNLQEMIARAQHRDVPVIICTLPANIRDVPPTFGHEPTDDAGYYRAREALERGRYRKAAQGFAAYSAAHPRSAFGYYWLGKAMDLGGEPARARQAYLQAVDWDDPGDRCATRRNGIIRGLGREDRTAVADVDAAFTKAVPDGLTDSRLFKDGVHWYDEYYPLVSLTIVEAAADYDRTHARPMLAPSGEWVRWWTPDDESRLSHPFRDPAKRARYADEIFMRGVAEVFKTDAFDLMESGIAYFGLAERVDDGIAKKYLSTPDLLQGKADASPWLTYVRERLKPEWSRVLTHAGEACRRLGRRDEAKVYFDEAIRLRPDDAYARLFRGRLLLSLGKKAEGVEDLRQAAASTVSPGAALWAKAAL